MLPDFSQRSRATEIIDDTHLDAPAMAGVLANLETINRFLGGFGTTLSAIPRLLPAGTRRVRVLDVGAGGGDMARRLVAWGRSAGLAVEVVAVDLSFAATAFARDRLIGVRGASVVQADALALPFARGSFDVVVCALFLHHFPQEAAVRVLRSMLAVGRYGVIVNDLHRHPLAWAGIRILCTLFGAHPIVRHDAAVSVLRGFHRAELRAIAERCAASARIRWRWAFRYQMVATAAG